MILNGNDIIEENFVVGREPNMQKNFFKIPEGYPYVDCFSKK